MATERQIAANRRNARKSTGPRSGAGKRRASRNSYRHGLSCGAAGAAAFAKHVEALARKIAERGADAVTLEIARSIARAEFDVALIRCFRVALISRISEFGELEVQRISMKEVYKLCRKALCRKALKRNDPIFLPSPAPSGPAMPTPDPERSVEAVRRALPELLKLDRYERRASGRRDRASRRIAVVKTSSHNQ
jgi:hypothetical protein